MGTETLLSSASSLRSGRGFLHSTRTDLRLVPAAGWLLFVRGVQAQYRQTWLRWAWLMLPGLVTAGVWTFLDHAKLLGVGKTPIPYAAYVLGGAIMWQLFFESLNVPQAKLNAARGALTKSRLPHEAYILAGMLEVLFSFLVRLVPFYIVLVISGGKPGWTVVLVPFGVLTLMTLGLALGMAFAPAGLLYQDIAKALTVGAGFWFFLTPVVYPEPTHGLAHLLVRLNPVTPPLVTTRAWSGGGAGSDPVAMAAVFAVSTLVLLAAWITYRLAQPHLVARL